MITKKIQDSYLEGSNRWASLDLEMESVPQLLLF